MESVLVSALTKVNSELGTATNFLTGAGADASSLLKGVDGVTALTLEDVAGIATPALKARTSLIGLLAIS